MLLLPLLKDLTSEPSSTTPHSIFSSIKKLYLAFRFSMVGDDTEFWFFLGISNYIMPANLKASSINFSVSLSTVTRGDLTSLIARPSFEREYLIGQGFGSKNAAL